MTIIELKIRKEEKKIRILTKFSFDLKSVQIKPIFTLHQSSKSRMNPIKTQSSKTG